MHLNLLHSVILFSCNSCQEWKTEQFIEKYNKKLKLNDEVGDFCCNISVTLKFTFKGNIVLYKDFNIGLILWTVTDNPSGFS